MIESFGASGDLSGLDFPKLITYLHNIQFEGQAHFNVNNLTKTLFFRRGIIAYGVSNDFKDALDRVLIKYDFLSEQKLKEATEAAVENHKSLAKYLIEQNLASSEDLLQASSLQVREIVTSLLLDKQISYFLKKDVLPDNAPNLLINPYQIIYDSITTIEDMDWIHKQLGSSKRIFAQSEDFVRRYKEISYTEETDLIITKIDSVSSIEMILKSSGFDPSKTKKILAALFVMGMLKIISDSPLGAPDPKIAPVLEKDTQQVDPEEMKRRASKPVDDVEGLRELDEYGQSDETTEKKPEQMSNESLNAILDEVTSTLGQKPILNGDNSDISELGVDDTPGGFDLIAEEISTDPKPEPKAQEYSVSSEIKDIKEALAESGTIEEEAEEPQPQDSAALPPEEVSTIRQEKLTEQLEKEIAPPPIGIPSSMPPVPPPPVSNGAGLEDDLGLDLLNEDAPKAEHETTVKAANRPMDFEIKRDFNTDAEEEYFDRSSATDQYLKMLERQSKKKEQIRGFTAILFILLSIVTILYFTVFNESFRIEDVLNIFTGSKSEKSANNDKIEISQKALVENQQKPVSEKVNNGTTTNKPDVNKVKKVTKPKQDNDPLGNLRATTSDMMKRGRYHDAAAVWKEGLSKVSGYTISIEIACSPDSVSKAYSYDKSLERLFLTPKIVQGRKCFRICWGSFKTLNEAQSNFRTLPKYYQSQEPTPNPIEMKKIF